MCHTSVAVALLFVLCCHQITSASLMEADTAIQLPRRSAEMYWVNRAMPNKFRKYRTYSVLQSMAPDEKKRYGERLKLRLAELTQL
ncbi:unnamed protein product [Caenorhabditis sp. 36 PRJEB53466]|nr:unnamed protein product [Caenorhabditis sp. 36 PRJEB53466]